MNEIENQNKVYCQRSASYEKVLAANSSESGVTTVEYAFLATLIAAGCILAVTNVGTASASMFSEVSNAVAYGTGSSATPIPPSDNPDDAKDPAETSGLGCAFIYELPADKTKYELVFQQGSTPDPSRTLMATYDRIEMYPADPNIPLWYGSEYQNSITQVTFKDKITPLSTRGWFFLPNLSVINNWGNLNTSKSTDMTSMFMNCGLLNPSVTVTPLDLSSFNTSSATIMEGMFNGCSSLKSLDLKSFNTSNVLSMRAMFDGCYAIESIDLSSFDTSKTTNMGQMFHNCSLLKTIDVSSFDTSKVKTMTFMFSSCQSLKAVDISNFNVSLVDNMSYMFMTCMSLNSISFPADIRTSPAVLKGTSTPNAGINSMFLSTNGLTGGFPSWYR